MEPFRRLAALACPLVEANIDTDQLIPARFMKESRASGYGRFLLHDLRFDAEGAPIAGFILNDPAAADARILVAGRNFGAGSSREAAVYALVDYGVRCVIAPSFGDIFASNAVNNGLLPAVLEEAAFEALTDWMGGAPAELVVDLEARRIAYGGRDAAFSIPDAWRAKLLNGWDDIALTRQHAAAIETFARERLRAFPWVAPRTDGPRGGAQPRSPDAGETRAGGASPQSSDL